MSPRERFRRICRFELKDDPFIFMLAGWPATYRRWMSEGMPIRGPRDAKGINLHLLGYRDQIESIIPNGAIAGAWEGDDIRFIIAIDPRFELRMMREDGDHVTMRDYDGTIVQRMKSGDTTIPRYLEYPVKDRTTWREYRTRLDPFSPGRWPEGWDFMTDDKLGWPIREGQTAGAGKNGISRSGCS